MKKTKKSNDLVDYDAMVDKVAIAPKYLWPSEYKPQKLTKVVEKLLGMRGRMVSGSKSGYNRIHPERVAIFNANVVLAKAKKIWYGDLDVTVDGANLIKLSKKLKETIYVLREMDARFENEKVPLVHKALFVVSKDDVVPSEEFSAYVQKAKSGKYKGNWVYRTKYRR